MKLEESGRSCHIAALQTIGEGAAQGPEESLVRRLKLIVRRRLSPEKERAWKNRTNELANRLCTLMGRNGKPSNAQDNGGARLQAGDWVRVRSLTDIEATLNHWRQLKGCTFMAEMAEYCGSTHRVLKPMRQFVDERDLRLKRSSGIVLLEGVMCKGTAEFGSCDRSCFIFWREEWLEKIQLGQS